MTSKMFWAKLKNTSGGAKNHAWIEVDGKTMPACEYGRYRVDKHGDTHKQVRLLNRPLNACLSCVDHVKRYRVDAASRHAPSD